jgi:hypothetical protein
LVSLLQREFTLIIEVDVPDVSLPLSPYEVGLGQLGVFLSFDTPAG